MALIKRAEFDASYLCVDVHDKPHCSAADLAIAQRYRLLLYVSIRECVVDVHDKLHAPP